MTDHEAVQLNLKGVGPVYHWAAGTLDAWLSERDCVYPQIPREGYTGAKSSTGRGPAKAVAAVQMNTLGDRLEIELKHPPAALHFVKLLVYGPGWWK